VSGSHVDVEAALARLRAGENKGLTAAAKHLLDVSQRLVPRDTGELERSGDSGLLRDGLAAVVYRDSKAIAAHEDLVHRHDGGRQAKYLEQPMHTEQSAMLALVAEHMREGLR
jgi:hypothetical protein